MHHELRMSRLIAILVEIGWCKLAMSLKAVTVRTGHTTCGQQFYLFVASGSDQYSIRTLLFYCVAKQPYQITIVS